jgi:hypothetical protein
MSEKPEELAEAARALVEKWRRQCDVVRAEMAPGGSRERYQEGPRYGVAAVESCADELSALLVQTPEEK